ncbi:MAG: hypothetical protein IJ749_07145 [Eubacterium sp.]|nr:hypothetical protein [Eubacterium sp.]
MDKKKIYLMAAAMMIVMIAIVIVILRGGNDEEFTANQIQIETTSTEAKDETSSDEKDSSEKPDELNEETEYTFRNEDRLDDHYEKHGKEMGFKDAESYEEAASDVVNNPEALHKTEKEDGDDVYYLKDTNEFVVVSGDGYIRTYFNPNDGINYYNRQ